MYVLSAIRYHNVSNSVYTISRLFEIMCDAMLKTLILLVSCDTECILCLSLRGLIILVYQLLTASPCLRYFVRTNSTRDSSIYIL